MMRQRAPRGVAGTPRVRSPYQLPRQDRVALDVAPAGRDPRDHGFRWAYGRAVAHHFDG